MVMFMVLKEMMGYRENNRILNKWKDIPKNNGISSGLQKGLPYIETRREEIREKILTFHTL